MGYIATADTQYIGGAISSAVSKAYGQGTTTGDDLYIYSNRTDSFPYLILQGSAGEVDVYGLGSFRLYGQASNEFLRFYRSGSVMIIFAAQGDDIYLNTSGSVKFGTYTAGAATDSTGYITIKDSGGTSRKLMVQA